MDEIASRLIVALLVFMGSGAVGFFAALYLAYKYGESRGEHKTLATLVNELWKLEHDDE